VTKYLEDELFIKAAAIIKIGKVKQSKYRSHPCYG